VRLFALSMSMDERASRVATRSAPAVKFLPLGFGTVRRHLTEREGLTA
jgi:hypothetical protein